MRYFALSVSCSVRPKCFEIKKVKVYKFTCTCEYFTMINTIGHKILFCILSIVYKSKVREIYCFLVKKLQNYQKNYA